MLLLGLISVLFVGCSRDPNVRKQKYFESGQHYLDKGQYREAAIQFKNAVQIDSTYGNAHYGLAQALLKLQQWNPAYQELARTLALQPEVILYDEPTTGLDPVNTARINHLINGIQRALKITSIVVTHDMGTAFSVSDRLVMIGRGRTMLVGTKDEFRNTRNQTVKDFIEGRAPETEDVAALLASS